VDASFKQLAHGDDCHGWSSLPFRFGLRPSWSHSRRIMGGFRVLDPLELTTGAGTVESR